MNRFSHYRDMKEQVRQFKGVVAACLAIAFEELSLVSDVDIKVQFVTSVCLKFACLD